MSSLHSLLQSSYNGPSGISFSDIYQLDEDVWNQSSTTPAMWWFVAAGVLY